MDKGMTRMTQNIHIYIKIGWMQQSGSAACAAVGVWHWQRQRAPCYSTVGQWGKRGRIGWYNLYRTALYFCSLYSHDHTHFLQVYGYEDDYLAELMLPEGSHRREEDKSFALLHRDMFQNRVEHINAGHAVSSGTPFSVQLYDLKNNLVWVNWCAAKLKVRLLEGGDVLGGDDDDTAKVSQTNHWQMFSCLHSIHQLLEPFGNRFYWRQAKTSRCGGGQLQLQWISGTILDIVSGRHWLINEK